MKKCFAKYEIWNNVRFKIPGKNLILENPGNVKHLLQEYCGKPGPTINNMASIDMIFSVPMKYLSRILLNSSLASIILSIDSSSKRQRYKVTLFLIG